MPFCTGLSPLARGTQSIYKSLSGHSRFIPAGAGNTLAKNQGKEEECGLSPLARGTHTATRPDPHATRFIPAGAGNTGSSRHRSNTASVYPRWRGEHEPSRMIPLCGSGLSPLARGTLNCATVENEPARFIPAGAGNTASSRISSPPISVYPRWRGEHRQAKAAMKAEIGLSPLVRGTRIITPALAGFLRFIPAGAGNTCRENA